MELFVNFLLAMSAIVGAAIFTAGSTYLAALWMAKKVDQYEKRNGQKP